MIKWFLLNKKRALIITAVVIVVIIIVTVALSSGGKTNEITQQDGIIVEEEGDKYKVEVRNPQYVNLSEKDLKKRLNIPNSKEVEVIYPGAVTERQYDEDPSYQPYNLEDDNHDEYQP